MSRLPECPGCGASSVNRKALAGHAKWLFPQPLLKSVCFLSLLQLFHSYVLKTSGFHGSQTVLENVHSRGSRSHPIDATETQ